MSLTAEFRGASLIVGSIIGAGVLGIPYAAAALGLIPSLVLTLAVGSVLYYTSIVLLRFSAERDGDQLATIATDVLGRHGGALTMIGMMIYIYGALLAYTSAGGSTIAALTPLGQVPAAALFWLAAAVLIYRGLEASITTETVLVVGIVSLFVLVAVTSLPHGDLSNAAPMNLGAWQAFLGVSLFAFVGHAMVPDVYAALGDYEQAKRSVRLAYVFVFSLYAILTVAFVLVFGRSVPQIAPTAFEQLYGRAGLIVGNLLPLITVLTSFIGFGLAGKRNYQEYVGLSANAAWAVTVLPPLALFIYGIRGFVGTLEVAGNGGAVIITLLVPLALLLADRPDDSRSSMPAPQSGLLRIS